MANLSITANRLMGSSMDAKERLLKIIEQRTKDNPISVPDLTALVNRHGYNLSERMTRDTVSKLRKEGVLILSVSKTGGGYYMSQSMEDYLEFRNHNILPRVTDMQDTMKQMDRAAQREYKSIAQERLF